MFNSFFSYINKESQSSSAPPTTQRDSSDSDASDRESEVAVSPKITPLAISIEQVKADLARIKLDESPVHLNNNFSRLRVLESKVSNMIVLFLEKRLKLYTLLQEYAADLTNPELYNLVSEYEKTLQSLFFDKQKPSHTQLLELQFKLDDEHDEYNKEKLQLRIEICDKSITHTSLKLSILIAKMLDILIGKGKYLAVLQNLFPQSILYGSYIQLLKKIISTKSVLHNTLELIRRGTELQQKIYLNSMFSRSLSLLILQSLHAYEYLVQIEVYTHTKNLDPEVLKIIEQKIAYLINNYTAFYKQAHEDNLKHINVLPVMPMVISEDLYAQLKNIMTTFGEPILCHDYIIRHCELAPVMTNSGFLNKQKLSTEKGFCLRLL